MKKFFYLPLVLWVAVGMTSCFDSSYDLKDIDKTVGISTNLVLPGFSTDAVELRNIMDLEEDGVLQVMACKDNPDDSVFVVTKGDSTKTDPIEIQHIKVCPPTIDDFKATLNLRDVVNVFHTPGPRKVHVNVSDNISIDIPNQTFHYDIKDGQAYQKMKGASASGISPDVLSIERVSFETVTIELDLDIKNFPSYIPYMHLDGLTLSLPKDLIVESCKFNGCPAKKIEPGLITLTDAIDNGPDGKGWETGHQKLQLSVSEGTFTEHFQFDPAQHKVTLEGEFEVSGSFRIESDEMVEGELRKLIEQELKTWNFNDVVQFAEKPDLKKINNLIPNTISFSGHNNFNNNKEIVITHVTGDFQHEVGKINEINLSDLPDFLNDEEVVLDLKNPMVMVVLESKMEGVTMHTKGDRGLILRNGDTGEEYSTGSLDIKPGTNRICIAADSDTYYLAAHNKYTQAITGFNPEKNPNDTLVIIPNLGNLIKKIPNTIEVDVADVLLHAENFDITKKYDLIVKYDVRAPLSFGEDFKLVYQKSETGLDLGDDTDEIDFEGLTIEAKASTTLPCDLTLSVTLLGRDGEPIDEAIQIEEVKIPKNAHNHAIKIDLKPKSGYSMRDILSSKRGDRQLDGITYRAVIDNPDTEVKAMPSTVYLLLKDIRCTLKGSLIYDAN